MRDLLRRLVALLNGAGIDFMVAGSFASTAHGLPRTTQDIDIVIEPTVASLEALLRAMPDGAYYVDHESARDAQRRLSMFNVIDMASGWKVDFIFRKNRAFSREEFRRRRHIEMFGIDVFVASPEDTILSKLEWSKEGGGSERQLRDVAGVLEARAGELDLGYIEHWIDELGLAPEWVKARTQVDRASERQK
jgi:hypothetical protein